MLFNDRNWEEELLSTTTCIVEDETLDGEHPGPLIPGASVLRQYCGQGQEDGKELCV